MSATIIYRTISFAQMLITLCFRLLYLALIFYLLYHFNENPVLIMLLTAIVLLLLLLSGNDYITLYADSLGYKSNALLKFFVRSKSFQLSTIKSVIAEGGYGIGDELESPRYSFKTKPLNKVTIEFTDGTNYSFETSIYIGELKKLVEEVNVALKKPGSFKKR